MLQEEYAENIPLDEPSSEAQTIDLPEDPSPELPVETSRDLPEEPPKKGNSSFFNKLNINNRAKAAYNSGKENVQAAYNSGAERLRNTYNANKEKLKETVNQYKYKIKTISDQILKNADTREDKKLLNDIKNNIDIKLNKLQQKYENENDDKKAKEYFRVWTSAMVQSISLMEDYNNMMDTFATELNDNPAGSPVPAGGKRKSKTRRRKHKKSKATRRR